jgi:hypothetical protein
MYGGFHLKSSFRRKSTSLGTRGLTPKLHYVEYSFALNKKQHRVIARKSHFMSSCDFQAIIQCYDAAYGVEISRNVLDAAQQEISNEPPSPHVTSPQAHQSPSISPFLECPPHPLMGVILPLCFFNVTIYQLVYLA